MPWPEMLHWQASGFANSWWIDPEVLKSLGPDATRYVRPNPAGGCGQMTSTTWCR